MSIAPADTAALAALAAELDCFTSAEFRQLAGITETTEKSWRHRHTSPPAVKIGRTVLYPKPGVRKWISMRINASLLKEAKAIAKRGSASSETGQRAAARALL